MSFKYHAIKVGGGGNKPKAHFCSQGGRVGFRKRPNLLTHLVSCDQRGGRGLSQKLISAHKREGVQGSGRGQNLLT